MAGYFLIVHDIVQYAIGRDLVPGPRLGGQLLLCYVLAITAVDALRNGLLFERFLSVEKAGPPDIDLDFEAAAARRSSSTSTGATAATTPPRWPT